MEEIVEYRNPTVSHGLYLPIAFHKGKEESWPYYNHNNAKDDATNETHQVKTTVHQVGNGLCNDATKSSLLVYTVLYM